MLTPSIGGRFSIGSDEMAKIIEFKPREAGARHYDEPAKILEFPKANDGAPKAARSSEISLAAIMDASWPAQDG
ncbi:dynein heavy chain protein 1 [Tepidicaulis marinus]|uniref:Dynein heavy chain protein 1 n=2 Tax=Tepidicaulis marinus TaxID=1333998 RepID=A0A081BAR1_9HYPH|nr:dynein heavy chain protein 1 [Tepidicaulis marinus]